MMSFSRIRSAENAASYYTDEDNDYVLGSMSEHWRGEGAKRLGLKGVIDRLTLSEALNGRLPGGADLSRWQRGVNTHRPGYDLTFSAPKSVSVMAMLGGDKRLVEAHNLAVDLALNQVESLASTRSMREGHSETVLTGNLIIACFNHDTSRDQDPHLHTHSVVINATRNGEKWQALSSDTVGKTGFSENVLANQIALGKIYRQALRTAVEKMGYEVEIVGRHDMWELRDVPVKVFSGRSKAIDEAVGADASPQSRDVAALDTRKAKKTLYPAQKMLEWMTTLKTTGFDMATYRERADQRLREGMTPRHPPSQADVNQAIRQAISLLSEAKTQFSYSDVLAKTVSQLPAQGGVIEQARAGIEGAIADQQLIPLDKEKGVFTSYIHVLDELSIKTLSAELLCHGRVAIHPHREGTRAAPFSDVVSKLVQDQPAIAILSGTGGAGLQRDRVAELIRLARAQGRDVQILTGDAASRKFIQNDPHLVNETVLTKARLPDGTAFVPHSTLIVDQGEKLSLKETVTLLEGALRNNVQLLVMDAQQRGGTGNALAIMRDSGSKSYRYEGGKQVDVTVISETDKDQRYSRLAHDYASHLKEGGHAVIQASGPREQKTLIDVVRQALKAKEILSPKDAFISTIVPVWVPSKGRRVRDHYQEGMVLEHWGRQSKSPVRFVIDRIAHKTHALTLRNEAGETKQVPLSALDSQWSLYRPQRLPVAVGEKLHVLGKMPQYQLQSGDVLRVVKVEGGQLGVLRNNQSTPQSLHVAGSPFGAIKVDQAWVEGLGRSVSDTATVFAAVANRDLDRRTLNQISRSGVQVCLYCAQQEQRTTEKLARHFVCRTVIQHLTEVSGREKIEEAMMCQKARLNTPAQQALHLAIPVLEGQKLAFSRISLLATAQQFGESALTLPVLEKEVKQQIHDGVLISVSASPAYGDDLLISRSAFDAEKRIIRHIAEGKGAVQSLIAHVPDQVLTGLTAGQQKATRLILETHDRFVAVQGYAGVGKTTQFTAVMKAINALPEEIRPRVVGLGPTHRAVGEMRSAGIDAQTLSSFLFDADLQHKHGDTLNYRSTVFVVDESSMIGNADMVKTYALITAGGGRAVFSGDSSQLQPISSGQPFKLQQARSAADVAIMKEIVRQTPALRPAVYSMIARDMAGALHTVEHVKPEQVPRQKNAWVPQSSVIEFTRKREEEIQRAAAEGKYLQEAQPASLYACIVNDYMGRTFEARRQTLIVTHLNEDRRAINAQIHSAREKAGELSGKTRRLPILVAANVRDGELRRISTWEEHRDARVLMDKGYHQITDIDAKCGLITLRDSEGTTRLLSPREATSEGLTLYLSDHIDVGAGDKIRFSKSDNERGYIANSVWTVVEVSREGIRLTNGEQTRTVKPESDEAQRHIDLAYAVTAHGAQGASESFAIALEGTDGGRERMVSFESVYVALSRSKQHVQVYTDNRNAWIAAMDNVTERSTAHDVLVPRSEHAVKNAKRLLKHALPLQDVAMGRALLQHSGLQKGHSLARWLTLGQDSQPHISFPVYDSNGKSAGIWLNPLKQGLDLDVLTSQGQVLGIPEAQFVTLQASRTGEVRLAQNMHEGTALAARHPESGIVVRLFGEGRPWNPGRMTGGKLWVDGVTDIALSKENACISNEVTQARSADEIQRQALERRAEQTGRAMRETDKSSSIATLPDEKIKTLISDVISRMDKKCLSGKLPVFDLSERQKQADAVNHIVSENRHRERFQQIENGGVSDKTLDEN